MYLNGCWIKYQSEKNISNFLLANDNVEAIYVSDINKSRFWREHICVTVDLYLDIGLYLVIECLCLEHCHVLSEN